MTAHSGLIPEETLADYQMPGMHLTVDAPNVAYYQLQCQWHEWQVQAVGESRRFHAVFIGREIPDSIALDVQGMVSDACLNELMKMANKACPKLNLAAMSLNVGIEPNIWLRSWENGGSTARIGVRQWSGQGGLSLATRYFAGLRINWIAM